ncbi:MAG: hypothetical protein U5K75_11100 [Ahrensia sp.]|nr:hypothetical protein [Ahrensia sp.]
MMLLAFAAAAAAAFAAPSASLKTEIKAALDLVLIDAPSARFQWQPVRSPQAYCAHFNSRNRLGGYSGWTLFCVNTNGEKMKVFLNGTYVDFAVLIAQGHGYDVDPQ